MGFLDIFKRKTLTDEVFGELYYTTFKESSGNFYEGKVDFYNKKMGVIIIADKTGPTQLQKDFFLKFQKNYSSIEGTIIIPFLKNKLAGEWQINDFNNEFEFDAVTIPRLPQTPTEWSISYFSLKQNQYVTINFTDYQPTNIQIDG